MFGLIVIRFLVSSGLFSQTRDKFEVSSGIVIPTLTQLYLKNIFYYFILYFNINNNYYYNVF